MPRLRPLVLACLLACGTPSAFAADCAASTMAQFENCILTSLSSGSTFTLNATIDATGDALGYGGVLNFLSNGGGLTMTQLQALNSGTMTFTSTADGALSTVNNLTANGTLNLQANTGTTLQITGGDVKGTGLVTAGDGGHAGTVQFQSRITGSLDMQVNGGTAVFNAANDYSGTTSIATGATLRLEGTGTLGSGALANNGALVVSTTPATYTIASDISGSGTMTVQGGNTVVLTGANTSTGAIHVNGTAGSPTTLRIAGASSLGSGSLNLDNGKLVAASSTSLGNTLYFSNTAAFAAASGTTMQLTGQINTSSNSTMLIGDTGNTGTVEFFSNAGNYSTPFTLTVSGGTLKSSGTAVSTMTQFSTVTTVAGGATLDLNDSVSSLFISKLAGAGTVSTGGNAATTLRLGDTTDFSGSINGAGGLIIANNATVTLGGANGYTGTTNIAAGSTLNLTSGGTLGGGNVTLGGTLMVNRASDYSLANNISGGGVLNQSGAGTLTLSGANTYTGATNVHAGTLRAGANGAFSSSSAFTVDSGATLDVNNTTQTVGSLAGAGGISIGTGSLTMGGNNTSTQLSGAITGSGTLAKAGSGTLTLSGTGAFSGNLNAVGGTLALHAGAVADSVAIDLGAGTVLDLADSGATVGSITGSGAVQLGSQRLTYSGVRDSTYGGAVSGTGGVTLNQGAHSVTWSGANTYGGSTEIASGTLRAGAANTLSANSAVVLGGASSRLDLNGYAQTIASLAGSNAASVVAIGGSTLTFGANNAATTYAGQVTGSGGFTKAGTGTTILSGNSSAFTGTTTIGSGTLAVNGSLGGNTNVGNGGILGGNGTVGNVTVLSGGVLAPGNSIGTLTVNGNLAFSNGSTYRVETDPAGNADKVAVNGNLTLAGALDVQAGSGSYKRNTDYIILTNTGTQAGSFGSISSNLAFLTPILTYNSNSVVLRLMRNDALYGSVGGSANQQAVGAYLDRLGIGATGGLADLIGRIDNLSAAGARNAFDSLSGSQHAAASQVAQGMGTVFTRGLEAHLAGGAGAGGADSIAGGLPWGLAVDAPAQLAGMFNTGTGPAADGTGSASGGDARETGVAASGGSGSGWRLNPNARAGLWGQALGAGGRIAGDGNGATSSYRSGGFMVGMDRQLSAQWLIGAAAGYQRGNWDADTGGNAVASGRIETPMGAVYARYTSGPWMVSAIGSYADNRFSTSRNVVIGSSASTAASTHGGAQWRVGVQVELALAAGSWEVRPLAGLRHARFREDAFTESGAGSANLSVDARTSRNTTLLAGVKGVRRFGAAGSEGAFELRAIASHLYGDNDTPVGARLAGQPAGFVASGTPLKRDALTLGAGVSRRIGQRLSGFADVNVENRGSGQSAFSLSAGLRYAW